ncbi:curli assembly protein CsgF [Methylorubrum sp. GM97]|uniref:curli assembly protein CsgF n=1 Tax=Methylorubrum sp. GM97 TaxID=2938232 RepID=UPI0021858309|nr:curli assembly protein CsgF [Methylorubrum sp. GM97]BDL41810.1 hypothetical protein MSPGM_44000 [Methylorubrum sp. GM97]
MKTTVLGVCAAFTLASSAAAGPLNYQPVNPSFGGSPLNGGWLQSQATAQNIFVRKRQLADAVAQAALQAQQRQTATSPASNFAAIINARLLAAVADRITNAIFGENAQPSGTFVVQGTTISFQQVAGNVQITVNDGASSSTVTVPLGF